ncbi:MAG: hypothetical protein KF753_22220 [Caldilineaceae bacterium]|nr:hypothetical protein [Caldilineaceae bacterium]
MSTQFDKTQFGQFAESDSDSTPAFFGMAMEAQIADGDFRTYVLLCQLAWQEHPQALSPWTERTYAELAALHPEHRPVSAETVRGRLNRLTRAGLITRERSGQSVWRTYPVLDGPLFPSLRATPHALSTQAVQPQTPIHLTLHLTLEPGVTTPQVRISRDGPQAGQPGWVVAAHPEGVEGSGQRAVEVGRVGGTHPDGSDRAPGTHPEQKEGNGQRAAPVEHVPATPGWDEDAQADQAGCALGTHPEQPALATKGAQVSERVAEGKPYQAGCALATHPQGSGRVEGTHPEVSQRAETESPAPAVETVTPGCAVGTHPDQPGRVEPTHPETAAPTRNPLGVRGAHTQTTPTTPGCAPGTHPDTPHTRVRARISTDFSTDLSSDLLSVKPIQKKESDQSVLSTDQKEGVVPIKEAGVGNKHTQTTPVHAKAEQHTPTPPRPAQSEKTAPAPASPDTGNPQAGEKAASTPNHPVLDLLNVLPVHEQLAVTLATLAPQGMNYEGIEECLKQPRLTQAWLDYVLAQGDEIRSPAAYIRQGVRSAKPPIARAKTVASPATPSGSPRKRGAFERMDPNEYTLWPFDAGEWRKIDPSISDEAFEAWVETHDPETVRPKFVQ